MTNLEVIRPFIERFITAVSNSLRLEMAIFDGSCQLFYCTPTYSKKKGRSVHTPSLQEVIENGSILINTPGEMASCIGCRFRDHCPSTIEILCCIHAGTEVAGVLAFTSFTKEGQKRITENDAVYLNAITEMANLFGNQLETMTNGQSPANLDASILPVMELCDQPLLLTDAHGVILQYNQLAEDLLKVCELTSASLWQIFPNSVVKRIMEGNDLFEKSVTISGMATKISTRAVKINGQVTGFYIRISDQLRALSKDTSYFEGIIGTSPAISEVQRMIRRIADSPTPVLITGETGTGKELIARAIHEQSRRSKYPFVAINCSSIPDNLFESELFGYEAPSPERKRAERSERSRWPRAEPCFWMRSGKCRSLPSQSSSGSFRNMSWNGWAPIKRSIWISGSLPPPTGTWVKWWQKRPSAETCITGST